MYPTLILDIYHRHIVYCASRLKILCFVVNLAVNVDKVRKCHCYMMYIKILFSNNCRSKII
jgi:hypothetical protein